MVLVLGYSIEGVSPPATDIKGTTIDQGEPAESEFGVSIEKFIRRDEIHSHSAQKNSTLYSNATVAGRKKSAQTIKALEAYWEDKHYLIIDRISMVSCKMFAKLLSIISCAKARRGGEKTDKNMQGLPMKWTSRY